MLGGGSRDGRRPGISRSFLLLYLLVSLFVSPLEFRFHQITPSEKSVSPIDSVRVRYSASSCDSSLCSSPICLDVESIIAQFSPGLSLLVPSLKRLSSSPVSARVSLNHRSALSPLQMGMRISLTLFDPGLFSSWLFFSVVNRSSTDLFYLEMVPREVWCSGPLVFWSSVPVEFFNSSSIQLDAIPSRETLILSYLLDEAQVSTEVTKRLIFVSNASTEPILSLLLRLDLVPVRHCSSYDKPVKSTNRCIPALSPLMGCSKRSIFLNPTGVYNPRYSSSRQDKYQLPTPIVPNLYSKFKEDFGVLHRLKSVMDEVFYESSICIRRVVLRDDHSYHDCSSRRVRYKLYSPLFLNLDIKLFFENFGLSLYGIDGVPESMGFVSDSIDYVFWLKDLFLDRKCYRLCTARVIGIVAKEKHTDTTSFGFLTGESFVNPPSRTLSSQTVSPASPDIHRSCCSIITAAWKETTKLGQTIFNLMGHGPPFILLIFVLLMGCEPYLVFPYLSVWAIVTEHGF